MCTALFSTASWFLPSHEKYSLAFWYLKACFWSEYWDVLNYTPIQSGVSWSENTAVNRIKLDKRIYLHEKLPFNLSSTP